MTKTPFVLSGGGARGFAHLGVLKALEEAGIYPSEIAATSAGALVGAFIADGFRPEEIKELVLKNIGLGFLLDLKNFRSNLISLHKIGVFMRKNLRHTRIEDLPIPLHVTATNFLDGTQHIFTQGDLVDSTLAASSIPAIFAPAIIDNIPLVDGGLYNNLPVEPFAGRKNEVIAIHVNPIAPFDAKSSLVRTIDRALHLSFTHTIQTSADGCRWFIEPDDLGSFGLFDLHKLEDIYNIGYIYTTKYLKHHGC